MFDQPEWAEEILAAALTTNVERLLADHDEAERRGRAAHAALEARTGAGFRTVDLLRRRGVIR